MRPPQLLLLAALALIPSAAWPQGDPLGPEFRLNTYTTNGQLRPGVAVDSSGNVVAVWESDGQDGDLRGVYGQRYSASGIPLGPEFQVNTYSSWDQDLAHVASDPSGNFVVVWTSQFEDGYGAGIFGQRYASSGAPLGPEFRVNTYTTGEQYRPSIASDAAGNFVVVWNGQTPAPPPFTDFDVFGQRFAATGAPLGPEFRVITFTTGGQAATSVAAEPSGGLIVAWVSTNQDGSSLGVFAQRFASSGGPLGPEFRLNTYTTNLQSVPVVAADASGNFVVVWVSQFQDGSSGGVFGQRFAASGSPLGPEFRVNTYTTDAQGIPQVAIDPSGNFVVVWLDGSQDGSGYGVFGQRYASSGASLGPEFQVNTYTTGSQRPYGVATDSMGRFVVVWSGSTGDGSGFGVFGQRFTQMVPVELMHFRVD
jgi:hypothetical protein